MSHKLPFLKQTLDIMKYLDGQEVLAGDKVIDDRSDGVVVYVIDTKQSSKEHPAGSWDYLEKGMMVQTVEMGLVHYSEPDEDVILIERAEPNSVS